MNPSEIDVSCPKCDAPPGRFCRMPSGGASRSHAARRRAWLKVVPEQPDTRTELGVVTGLVRVRPTEHLVLALELAVVEPASASECAELLEDAAGAIEDAATRCDGGAYWMDDHAVGRERSPCPGCLALARRLRDRAERIRTGAA